MGSTAEFAVRGLIDVQISELPDRDRGLQALPPMPPLPDRNALATPVTAEPVQVPAAIMALEDHFMKFGFSLALAAALAIPVAANAAPCKDAKGKFIKCPQPAAAPAAVAPAARPATAATHAAAAPTHAATPHKGPCRDAKTGRFTKCS